MGLLFDPDALRDIPRQDVDRLLTKVAWLWEYREQVKHSPLRANLSGYFKRRLGNYRIIYTYDPNPDDMVIHLVGLRDDIYRRAL